MTHTRRECVISNLRRRLGNAELLIEHLNGSVKRGKCLFLAEHGRSERLRCALENFIKAYYRGLIGAVPDMPPAFAFLDNPPPSPIVIRNLLEDMVREAEYALRAAEESSVVEGIMGCAGEEEE